MSENNSDLKLTLKDAPLIAAYCLMGPGVSIWIGWPQRLRLAELSAKTYKEHDLTTELNWIGRQYQALIANKKTKNFAPHIFPYLGRVDATITAHPNALSAGLERLSAVPLPYCQKLTKSLEDQLAIRNMPEKPTIELNGPLITNRKKVSIIKAEPINELHALQTQIYQKSGLPYGVLEPALAEHSYQVKEKMFKEALRSENVNLSINYQIEIVCEPHLMQKLLASNLAINLLSQFPTTTHGYKLPEQIADGGMLERSFDKSYELYGKLQTIQPELTQLVCLYGHRQRFLIETNIRKLMKTRKNIKNLSAESKLFQSILKELELKHPLVSAELQVEIEGE